MFAEKEVTVLSQKAKNRFLSELLIYSCRELSAGDK